MGVRTWVVVGLAGWFGWVLVRGLVTRRVPWVSLAVLLVPLVWLLVTERQ